MMKIFSLLLIFWLVFSAKAELLYDLSPFDPEQAFASDSVPGQFNNQRLAEAFSLSIPAEIARMKWWGRSEGAFFEDLQNMETFTVAVFTDSGGLPGTNWYPRQSQPKV